MISQKIVLHQQDSLIFIRHSDIMYCQSDNCYTSIHLINNNKFIIVKSLKKFHQELPFQFIRVSQSYVINQDFIEKIDKKRKRIKLEGEKEIPFTVTLKELISLLKDNVDVIL